MTGSGDEGDLEALGLSVDGVRIDFDMKTREVMVDSFGPSTPFDVQYMLMTATIHCDLVWYDIDVLEAWLTNVPLDGASPTPGTFAAAGSLYIANSYAARLLIKSTPAGTGLTAAEHCWNFPNAFLIDSQEGNFGTVNTVWRLTFRAIAAGASVSQGAVLWNTTCS